jgi:hypothetical protein
MPKTITGSVGRGGRNYPHSDVMTVQYLLNCVPAAQGGPAKELVVDGAAGPRTIAAIEGFQRRLGGFADGRVDPGGATLRALQARDPHPNQSRGAGPAQGGGPAHYRPSKTSGRRPARMPSATAWRSRRPRLAWIRSRTKPVAAEWCRRARRGRRPPECRPARAVP